MSSFKPKSHVGHNRDYLLEQASYESAYEEEGIRRQEEAQLNEEKQTGKGLLKFFGYKHVKSMRFYAQLLRCLRDCFEAR